MTLYNSEDNEILAYVLPSLIGPKVKLNILLLSIRGKELIRIERKLYILH
jgi:hypothetical protein